LIKWRVDRALKDTRQYEEDVTLAIEVLTNPGTDPEIKSAMLEILLDMAGHPGKHAQMRAAGAIPAVVCCIQIPQLSKLSMRIVDTLVKQRDAETMRELLQHKHVFARVLTDKQTSREHTVLLAKAYGMMLDHSAPTRPSIVQMHAIQPAT
jgi:hypothetical protein